MRTQLHARLSELASRRHGVVSREQLEEIGFKSGAITRMIAAKRLIPKHRGVYAVGHSKLSRHGALIAAVLACGVDAVLSHRSAAWLWGLRPDNRRRVDVTVPRPGQSQRTGIHVHTSQPFHKDDITEIDGIPVTSLARTLLDLAEVVPVDHVAKCIEEAMRKRIYDHKAVQDLLSRSHGRRGRRPLRLILADAFPIEPATRAELEREFQKLIRTHRLAKPNINTLVEGHEVDAVWLKPKVIVELDGFEGHGTRRAFEDDRVRDATLQLAGYRVIRITWRRLKQQPDEVARTLQELLSRSVP